MSKLNDEYMRDLDAGLVRSVYGGGGKKRKKRRWHPLRKKVIHKRPEPDLWRWLRLKVWERDGWTCQYCGSKTDLQVDHVWPISKGGTNRLKNLVTACRPCNRRKLARILPHKKFQKIRDGIKERFLGQQKARARLKDEMDELNRLFRDKMDADE